MDDVFNNLVHLYFFFFSFFFCFFRSSFKFSIRACACVLCTVAFDYEFKKEFFLGIRKFIFFMKFRCLQFYFFAQRNTRLVWIFIQTKSPLTNVNEPLIAYRKFRFLCAFYKYINRLLLLWLLLLAAILPPFFLVRITYMFFISFCFILCAYKPFILILNDSKQSIKCFMWSFSVSQIWILRKLTNIVAHSFKSSYLWVNMFRI